MMAINYLNESLKFDAVRINCSKICHAILYGSHILDYLHTQAFSPLYFCKSVEQLLLQNHKSNTDTYTLTYSISILSKVEMQRPKKKASSSVVLNVKLIFCRHEIAKYLSIWRREVVNYNNFEIVHVISNDVL